MATSIEDLEERLNTFEASLLQMAENLVPQTAKIDDTSNKVEQITPYTETKTAYYGEKEKTFYNIPDGNITVLFDNYNGSYSVSRTVDRVTVSFDTLSDATNITISVK